MVDLEDLAVNGPPVFQWLQVPICESFEDHSSSLPLNLVGSLEERPEEHLGIANSSSSFGSFCRHQLEMCEH